LIKQRLSFFARRSIEVNGKPYVAKAIFEKQFIEAYLPSFDEGEFVVRPLADIDFHLEEMSF
jgi:hypothetical protein